MSSFSHSRAAGASPLRSVIEDAQAEHGAPLKDFTVLSAAIDPYRIDTPANHAVGQWFADQMKRLNLTSRRLHLRGIHYALLGNTKKPNGEPYINTDENWDWLQSGAAKAARWLSYVDFSAITDARNEPPEICDPPDAEPTEVTHYVSSGVAFTKPEIHWYRPSIYAEGFDRNQPYRLALYGEKKSLERLLAPLARDYDADLFLPTGEISDTQLWQMAKAAIGDGRPLIVFTVTDFDPAGWQMSISIGRKLQALRDLLFPDLRFEVHPVALTAEQVRELDLPSTPLKETEQRGDKWRTAMGREQTEIDALATLRPNELRSIVRQALDGFYDTNLTRRLGEAERAFTAEAMKVLNEHVDHARLLELKRLSEEEFEAMVERIDALDSDADRIIADVHLSFPVPMVPGPEIDEGRQAHPLISSDWTWSAQTQALRARKEYR